MQQRYGALYLRISKDKHHGESTEDQEVWGRAYAAQHWPADLPLRVYCDDDLTAADEDVHRPDYERLREDLRRGEVACIWTVEQSRLERTRRGWVDLADDLLEAEIEELHTNRDGLVRLDEVADIKAMLNAHEARRTKRRVNDRLDRLAARGRPPGGTSFGYEHVVVGTDEDDKPIKTLAVIEDQAEAARWMAQAVLDGWSLAATARELDVRGVPTRRGGAWTTQTVRSVLTSPTITNLRRHRGEVVGEGNWSPILDRATWHAVQRKLTEPASVTDPRGNGIQVSRSRRPARKYLLTGGLARCGRPREDGAVVVTVDGEEVRVCGAPLVAQSRAGRTPGSRPAYLCVARQTRKGEPCGCGGLGILADDLEAHVTERALSWAATPEVIQARDTQRLQADAEVRAVKHQLGQLDEAEDRADTMAVDGQLTPERHGRQLDRLAKQRGPLQERLRVLEATVTGQSYSDHITEVRARWDDLNVGERCRVLRDLLVVVYVRPARPGTRKFDARRVDIRPDWGSVLDKVRRLGEPDEADFEPRLVDVERVDPT